MTPNQLASFSQILDKKLDEKLDIKLSKLKKDLELSLDTKLEQKLEEKLNEKLAFLPTKDNFYTKMDEIMGEIQAIREEVTVLSHHSSQHTDDIDKLKSIHPNFAH